MSIEGGLGANTGGAVSVTSGVGTADDSGSMTIATADSGSSGESGNMTVSTGPRLLGRRGRFGGDGHRNWRRGGAISLSVGDGNTGPGAVTVTREQDHR